MKNVVIVQSWEAQQVLQEQKLGDGNTNSRGGVTNCRKEEMGSQIKQKSLPKLLIHIVFHWTFCPPKCLTIRSGKVLKQAKWETHEVPKTWT